MPSHFPRAQALKAAPAAQPLPAPRSEAPAAAPPAETSAEPEKKTGGLAHAVEQQLELALSAARRMRNLQVIGLLALVCFIGFFGVQWAAAMIEERRNAAPLFERLQVERNAKGHPGAELKVQGRDSPSSDKEVGAVGALLGGESQARYEVARRSLDSDLASRGLRAKDLAFDPRAKLAWRAQEKAARERDYGPALQRLHEFRARTADLSTLQVLLGRLGDAEGRVRRHATIAERAQMKALRATAEAASQSAEGVRDFMRRIDAIEDSRPSR